MPDKKVTDIHIIWMTTGLSCDGDSVAMTGAVNPSLEDIALGALPGVLHNRTIQRKHYYILFFN
jgi:hydrogenase small subunit